MPSKEPNYIDDNQLITPEHIYGDLLDQLPEGSTVRDIIASPETRGLFLEFLAGYSCQMKSNLFGMTFWDLENIFKKAGPEAHQQYLTSRAYTNHIQHRTQSRALAETRSIINKALQSESADSE